ncbi:hypothetical protein [Streptomyces sp. NRRL F-5123]|uniref:hypothetical protein n=1 Tax=Streptomyces sp. NRRL F-5123 TaxID=1463856 RepID=UPI0004E25A33|nr:hypothetical protein [Streptomyces sp. NRRL F-5123]
MNRNRTIASAAAAVVLSAALVACGGSDGDGGDKAAPSTTSAGTSTAATSGGEQTPDATPSSTAPPGANVGDTLSLIGAEGLGTSGADVTLLKYNDHAKPSLGAFAAPPGYRLVAAEFSILNTGQVTYDDPGNMGTRVVDSNGKMYTAVPGIPTDGDSLPLTIILTPGNKVTGWVVLNVPEDAKIVAVTYQMDRLLQGEGKNVARWNLPS